MICKSCGEDINVKMKKALKANECPYCGNLILDKEKMQQFVDLQGILIPQRFTDNPSVDERIKDKVIRVLMEHMKCIKIKDISQEEDIVKLGETKVSKKGLSNVPTKSSNTDLVEQQSKMREDIYREVVEEQYGEPQDVELSDEDLQAAEGVVFSSGSTGENVSKADRLKNLAPVKSSPRPIQRIQ